MVFYDPLPTELWFIIYKMEHSSFLSAVNTEIKTLNREIELLNNIEADKSVRGYEYEDFPRAWAHCCPQVTSWTIKEWNSFRRVHPAIYIRTNGSLDIYNPNGGAKFGSDAYGYGWDIEMRRDVVVMYLEDW